MLQIFYVKAFVLNIQWVIHLGLPVNVDFLVVWRQVDRRPLVESARPQLFIIKTRPGSRRRDGWVHIQAPCENGWWVCPVGFSERGWLQVLWVRFGLRKGEGGEEGDSEANAAEQKDRKETTSGLNEIRCPQEFALYGKITMSKSCPKNTICCSSSDGCKNHTRSLYTINPELLIWKHWFFSHISKSDTLLTFQR